MCWTRHHHGNSLSVSSIHGGTEQNQEADWIVIPDSHPALVSHEQFASAKSKRENRRTSHGGQSYRVGQGANSRYLLSGLIQCDRCGHY